MVPGQTIKVKLDSLPPCLEEIKSGKKVGAMMTATLPDDYSPEGEFPVLLFLGGGSGGSGNSNGEARFFTEGKRFVALSLPLYKKSLNSSGIDIYINEKDFEHIAEAYEKAFELLREQIPNLSDSGWVAGGFSNGAHSMGGIINDSKLKKLFSYFILAEGGNAIGSLPRGTEGILLIGEKSPCADGVRVSKSGKIKGFPRMFSKLKKRNVEFVFMLGVGHAFPEEYKLKARQWLQEKLKN